MENNRLNGVISALKQKDCIIFIGSGISMWSGLPSWKGLLEKLSRFMENCGADSTLVKREIANGDLQQAASYGFSQLTKPQIGEFMLQACCSGCAEPHFIHQKILELGPRCFITTNYDQLIEMAIYKWHGHKKIRVVTNRQLVEMGMIRQATAEDFVYKPHGDIGDIESIILTREQYRTLLVDGERHMALETLRFLLESRPVVYIGFGLKDPDFLYIKDILFNMFKGNVRDHYAVMADIEDAESDYWRKNYGIHLIGYQTVEESGGGRSHQPLISLLQDLNKELHGNTVHVSGITKSEVLLAFIRYAVIVKIRPKALQEFKIYVHSEKAPVINEHTGIPVNDFLGHCQHNTLLIGLPGAGKSYAMQRTATILAEKLQEKCLQDTVELNDLVIPIYIDLKLYDGNLERMLERAFPKVLSLSEIMQEYKCRIFLDSFNEMPKEYRTDHNYRQDFEQTLQKFKNAVVIIGSRTEDGLQTFPYLKYYLDKIDRATIDSELKERGIHKKIDEIMYEIISNPFYFQCIISGKIKIDQVTQPKHFYKGLFSGLQKDFQFRFGKSFELIKTLSAAAYRALDIGIEAFPAEFVYEELKKQNSSYDVEKLEEIVNWMIYREIFIPHMNGKITFLHQSITEYFAATVLMQQYAKDKSVIINKMKYYRWDQVVLFVIHMLPAKKSDNLIRELLKTDFALALKAVPYVEFQKDRISDMVLNEIISNKKIRCRYRHDIERSLSYDLPVTYKNEKKIRKIIDLGDKYDFEESIGEAAVSCLYRLKGRSVKNEFMQWLYTYAFNARCCKNYSFLHLQKMIEESDLDELIIMIDHIQEELFRTPSIQKNISVAGFYTQIGIILQKFPVSTIKRVLIADYELSSLPQLRKNVLLSYLNGKYTADALKLITEFFMAGYKKACISMHFIMLFSNEALPWDFFGREHIDRLIDYMNEDIWTLRILKYILENRRDLCRFAKERAKQYDGMKKAAILYCVNKENVEIVFHELEALLYKKESEIEDVTYKLIMDMDLVWNNREDLFIRLMMKKNVKLASALMGEGVSPPKIEGFQKTEMEDVDWCLQWIRELENNYTIEKKDWFLSRLSRFLTEYTGPYTHSLFLTKFNEGDRNRRILLQYIIPWLHLKIDDLHESAMAYIFDDLKKTSYQKPEKHFLGYAVDDKFVTERILPLLDDSNETFKNNLIDIILTAGRRLGKRYLL